MKVAMPQGPEESKLYIRNELPPQSKKVLSLIIVVGLVFVIGNIIGRAEHRVEAQKASFTHLRPEMFPEDGGNPVPASPISDTHEMNDIIPRLEPASTPTAEEMPVAGKVNPLAVLVEPEDPSIYAQPNESVVPNPAVEDPWLNIDDGFLVPHPRREPDDLIQVKVSWYNPALGGPNCFRFVNGYCQSPLANGERWEDNYGIAIACPRVMPFGTIIEFGGKRGICKDRGGKIVQAGHKTYWIDQLLMSPEFAFGTQLVASVWYPG